MIKYLEGFTFNIGNIRINFSLKRWNFRNRPYFIKVFGIYYVVIVNFKITIPNKPVDKSIDITRLFYMSSGTSSGSIGKNTWLPVHCVTIKKGKTPEDEEYSFISNPNYSKNYFYKIGQFYREPFASCKDVYKTPQIRLICDGLKSIPFEKKSRQDDRRGLQTLVSRFANMMYLTTSYFLFYKSGSFASTPTNYTERMLIRFLQNISSEATFSGTKWKDSITKLEKYYKTINFEDISKYNITGENFNRMLYENSITLPYFNIGIDMKEHNPNLKLIYEEEFLILLSDLYFNSDDMQIKLRAFYLHKILGNMRQRKISKEYKISKIKSDFIPYYVYLFNK